MKRLEIYLCLFLSLFLLACEKGSLNSEINTNNQQESEQTKDILQLPPNFKKMDIEVDFDNNYTLKDNSGYNYDIKNLTDNDLSTSWCLGDYENSDEDLPPWYQAGQISIYSSTGESFAGKWLSIIPGYGRDDEIYWENNRIKTLNIQIGPSPLAEDNLTFYLEDKYDQQLFQINTTNSNFNLGLTISDVYPGTKYDDTCIAELGVWSLE